MVVAIGALLVALGGVAYAAIPDDGTIDGCYQNVNGQLRVVEDGVACRASETAIAWNQTGPAGADGQDGVSGLEMVQSTSARSSSAFKFQTVTCPAGKKVVGPSFNLDFGRSEVHIDEVIVTNGGTSVRALALERPGGSTTEWSLTAIALCASVTD